MRLSFLFFIILLSSKSYSFESDNLKCVIETEKEMALIFANGMFTDEEGARRAVLELKKKTNYKFKYYDLAYNQSEKVLNQALEVIEQKMGSAQKFLWSFLADFNGPNWLNILLKKLSYSIDAKSFLTDLDLRSHIKLYKKYLNEEEFNIIIVSHSQGNFYANQAFDILEESIEDAHERVHIVSIANPDSRVSGSSGKYKTLKSDGVINSIPLAMKANSENLSPAPGLFDHGFLKHYLDGEPTGDKIFNIINSTARDSLSNKYYLDFGYVDESLNEMNMWVKKIDNKEIKRSLEKHECLAVSLFLKTESWFGESCHKRSYQAVREFGDWCLKNEWSKNIENMCIVYGQLPGLGGGVAQGEAVFSGRYEECRWKPSTIKDELTKSVLSRALAFIKNPESK